MNFSKGLVLASHVALTFALALTAGDALANGDGGTAEGGSTSGDSGAGETGGDPGDFSSAWFVSPLPNASFDVAPATLDAEIGVHQGVDDAPIVSVEVFLDDISIGAQDCAEGCTFPDIEIPQGVHQLRLATDSGYSALTMVYVDEELPNSNNDCGDPTSDTGETGGNADDGDGGGSCSVTDRQAPPWGLLALPAMVLLAGVRRRR